MSEAIVNLDIVYSDITRIITCMLKEVNEIIAYIQ